MAAYMIVDGILDNPERYEDYKKAAKPIVEQFGGEYLVRGGPIHIEESALWSPTRMVVVRFPDMATAKRFYDSPGYQQALIISKESARRTVLIMEGAP